MIWRVVLVAAAMLPVAFGALTCGTPSQGPVLGGVDVVEIVRRGQYRAPLQGFPEFAVTNPIISGDYSFWFRSKQNAAMFEEMPSLYLPAYGGY